MIEGSRHRSYATGAGALGGAPCRKLRPGRLAAKTKVTEQVQPGGGLSFGGGEGCPFVRES